MSWFEELFINEVKPALNRHSGSGGGDVDPNAIARSILDKSITEYIDNNLTVLSEYALYNCASLETISIPNVTVIGTYALYNTAIKKLDSTTVTSIGKYGVGSCKSLKYVNLPNMSGTGANTFAGCSLLETVSLPALKTLYRCDYTFSGCSALKNVDLSGLETLGSKIFLNCASLEEIEFPSVTSMYDECFSGCTNLKKIDFGSALTMLRSSNFKNCAKLDTVILRGETVSKLDNTNNFDGTPFASGGTGGTVYCPAALITQYQQATNWSALYSAGTCNFVAIEGSEYE